MATQPTDEWMANPVFAGRALTPPLTSFAPPAPQKKRNVPPAVGRIIGELGLRYRPANASDLEAHAERLKLLAEDVADVPAHLLEAASKRWVRDNPFMPKASDLVALARGDFADAVKGTDFGQQQLQSHCDQLNAANGGRDGWRVVGAAPKRTIAKARDADTYAGRQQ